MTLRDPRRPRAQAAATRRAATPAILWVAGNVHGGEESGTDASLRVLYELAARTDCAAAAIRDNAVVVILPTQNPDGREADTRRNAYGFDMNRDWFARTQPETDGKLELLRQYPPHALHRRARDGRQETTSSRRTPTRSTTRSPTSRSTGSTISTAPAMRSEFDRAAASRTSTTTATTCSTWATATRCRRPASARAGMTFEKGGDDAIAERVYEQYVAHLDVAVGGRGAQARRS